MQFRKNARYCDGMGNIGIPGSAELTFVSTGAEFESPDNGVKSVGREIVQLLKQTAKAGSPLR